MANDSPTPIKNPGTKQKGVLNKNTEEWNKLSNYLLTDGLGKFQEELNRLQGKNYVQAYLKALEFVLPKLARVELSGDEDKPLEQRVTFIVKDQSGKNIKEMGNDKIQDATIIN